MRNTNYQDLIKFPKLLINLKKYLSDAENSVRTNEVRKMQKKPKYNLHF